jgi:ribosomal protein S18 acetylase RimI-like enzyme
MIKKIVLNTEKITTELISLQRASYAVEAEIIGYYDIPPLKETAEDLMNCGETFFGFYLGEQLAGAISFTLDSPAAASICRMIVHPNHFRKGIAQQLLDYLELKLQGMDSMEVSTGKLNSPAITLYKKNGFHWLEDIEVAPDLIISRFLKIF